MIAFIEGRHQAAASQITALEASLAAVWDTLDEAREEAADASANHAATNRRLHDLQLEHEALRLEADDLRTEHRLLQGEHDSTRRAVTIHQQQRDQLVAACDELLRESPATWGRAHIALRDLLASLRLPRHNLSNI